MNKLIEYSLFGNPLKEWAIALAIVVGSVVLAKLLYLLFGRLFRGIASRTSNRLDDILIDMLEEPVVFAVIIIGMWWGYDHLSFGESFQLWAQRIFQVLIAINITWFIARVVDAVISEYLIPYAERSKGSMDQIMPVVRKSLKAIVWSLGVVLALNNAGYDVGALLAGVGIGGLAMAMAAKDFVANIFGGITVLIDKPFTVGDRILISGMDGTVKEVGIRTTRLQTAAGRMVTIPNHKFTDSAVENISVEPARKVVQTFGLTYDTSPVKMEEASAILHAIADDHRDTDDGTQVWFSGFGDSSLDLTLVYYITKGAPIGGIQGDINMEVLKQFNAAGLEFAFPTQTVHERASKDAQGGVPST